ncbi:hypothetical protein [Streptomyces sp. DH37]|uniref:hypothetical protein n=1 Tax=Streptomyces sp. DH37 TaxID=3040122 RepID=UPI0024412A89|nr:hypothetical protein [Streptomyces sp. DH37]MDG9701419.1 hypothetical protein [Streptomyces sp. DH37]
MQQTRPDGPAPAAVPVPAVHDAVAEAACGYWRRRGLPTEPGQVVAAPTAPLLLLALLAAADGNTDGGDGAEGGADTGGVVLPRPGPAWHADQARLLGRPLHPVPVPAECGGVPDPFALLESVGRARAGGGDPRVLLLSVADGLTGTAAPPELLHEVCEAAVQEDLLVISDESWRDTSHDPHGTVTVSPAEILHRPGPRTAGTHAGAHAGALHGVPGAHGREQGGTDHDSVVVLVDLGADPESAFWPGTATGVARLPATGRGRELGRRTRAVLAALHARPRGRDAEAAAEALGEPEPLREHRAAGNRVHAVLALALHRALTGAGAVCRPPHAGRHLYPDFEALRPALAARGIEDAAGLEAELVRRLGPYALGGHRFGDDPRALRVRLSTDVLARGASPGAGPTTPRTPPSGPPDARHPLERPEVTEALASLASALEELTAGGPAAAHPVKFPDADGSPA